MHTPYNNTRTTRGEAQLGPIGAMYAMWGPTWGLAILMHVDEMADLVASALTYAANIKHSTTHKTRHTNEQSNNLTIQWAQFNNEHCNNR